MFSRTPKLDLSKKNAGHITNEGLLSTGTNINPFVSPASYLGHSGIQSEKGKRHIEKMCQEWTTAQIDAALKEENREPGRFDPVKARVGSSTLLASLLLELDKGRLPSDVQPGSITPGAIGANKGFNICSSQMSLVDVNKKLGHSLTMSPMCSPRLPCSPSTSRIFRVASGAARNMGESMLDPISLAEATSSLAQAQSALDKELAREGPERDSSSSGLDDLYRSASAKLVEKNGKNPQNLPVDTSFSSVMPPLTPAVQIKDEEWLNSKIETSVANALSTRSQQENRLAVIMDQANTVIAAFVDQMVLRKQSSPEAASTHEARRSMHTMEENRIRSEIDHLDLKLMEIQLMARSNASSANHVNSCTYSLYQDNINTAVPLFESSKEEAVEEKEEEEEEKIDDGYSSVIDGLKTQIAHLEQQLGASSPWGQNKTRRVVSRNNVRSQDSKASTCSNNSLQPASELTKTYTNFQDNENLDLTLSDEEHEDSSDDIEEGKRNGKFDHTLFRQQQAFKQQKMQLGAFELSISPVANAIRDIMLELKSPHMFHSSKNKDAIFHDAD